MFVTFDDGDGGSRVVEFDEVGIIPGVGVTVRDAEGVERLYPWHRIALLERIAPTGSVLYTPGGPDEGGFG